MFEFRNVIFALELLAAELIFLFSAEKKNHFVLRYILSVAAALFVASMFPIPEELKMDNLYQFFRIISIFAVTVLMMAIPFKLNLATLISSCVAGYAAQHIAYHVVGLVGQTNIFNNVLADIISRQTLIQITIFPAVYLIVFLTFGLLAAKNYSKRTDMGFDLTSLIIVFVCLGLSRFVRYFGDTGSVSVSLYAITCCILALVVQFVLYRNAELRLENATMGLLWREDRKQYELSKKSIETVNIKYHDLKHKLANLRGRLPDEEIDSLKEAARIYGSRIKTGNEALDVILTENNLRCSEEGITITYMGNGADLSFMNIMDIYSLFGNAVENAVEAVRKVDDPEKKIINIVTERMGDMIIVDITNFFNGEITIEDGLPVTTKPEGDIHGFGMKSMRLITEKYSGRLTAETEGDVFSLGIFLIVPSK